MNQQGKPLTADQDELIRRYIVAGLHDVEIAASARCSVQTVRNRRKSLAKLEVRESSLPDPSGETQ